MPSAGEYQVAEVTDGQDELHPQHRHRKTLRDAFHLHRQKIEVGNMEREQPFSWQYCLISLASYALMLSDVFRTGLGIRNVNQYPRLEADLFVYFGPHNYVTHHVTTANASASEPANVWTYKYDTTSVTMRAVAEHLKLESWPPCIFYHSSCESFTLATAFEMLVDTTSTYSSFGRDGLITLRSTVEYKDRVYHHALPRFFERNVKRTSQAIHYKYDAFTSISAEPICGISSRRPYSCKQAWTNLGRLSCATRTTNDCVGVDTSVWKRIPQRTAELARLDPNHTIDFVILDGAEDYSRGALSYQGRKYFEVVVFTRIRQCHHGTCETVAVDDYRFEAAAFVMNAPS